MPTPYAERSVLNILDLQHQPPTSAVLVCSGDGNALVAFMIAVDSWTVIGDIVRFYRGKEPIPVLHLSKDIPFVVFDRSVLEMLTAADRAKIVAEDEKAREVLLREHDPDAAASLVAHRAQSKAAIAAFTASALGQPADPGLELPHSGQYL